jgi:purine-binding chemotaxis protein CheW
MQSTKQAVFRLGDEEYSLNIMDVNSIEKAMTIETVSSLPENVKGVIKLRGDIIPVYSLRKKLGMEEIQPGPDTRFIVTDSNGILMAYEVDKMSEIVLVDENQLNAVPSIIKDQDTSYIKSVTNVGARLILNLDNNGILTGEEQSKIKAVLKK